MTAARKTRWNATLQEYFAADDASADRLYYLGGEIFVMQGGSAAHGDIILNISEFIRPKLRVGDCRMSESGVRIRYGKRTDYGYSDSSIVCGKPEYDSADPSARTILNPRIIFEVLSDSTERFDRGEKFELYKQIPSFEEYVLISQREAFVQTHLRDAKGGWYGTDIRGPDKNVTLNSIGLQVAMAELYRDVTLIGMHMRPAPFDPELG